MKSTGSAVRRSKRWLFSSLRNQVLLIVLLTTLPAYLLLLRGVTEELQRERAEALQLARSTVTLTAGHETQLINSTEVLLDALGASPEVQAMDPEGCQKLIEEYVRDNTAYQNFSVATPSGDVICSLPPPDPERVINVSRQPDYELVQKVKHVVLTGFQRGTLSDDPALTLSKPLLDARGNVVAILGASLDIQTMNQLAAGWNLPPGAAITIIDPTGTVVLRYPDAERWVGKSVTDTGVFRFMAQKRDDIRLVPGLEGQMRWYAITRVFPESLTLEQADSTNSYLYVGAGFADETLLAAANAAIRRSLLSLAGVILAGMAVAGTVTSLTISRQSKRIIETTQQLQSGDLNARTGMSRDVSELGRVGQSVDEMAEEIRRRELELQVLAAELEQRVLKRTEQLQLSNTRLLASQSELRRLSQELLRTTERERIRISHEVHDRIGQALTGIKMDVHAARRNMMKQPKAAVEHLDSALALIDETVEIARQIARELRPSVLDDFGLAAAVEGQLRDTEAQSGLRCHLVSDIEEEKLSTNVSTAAFRIFQEALTNVIRHANATEVRVTISNDDHYCYLTIQDNGRGIREAELQTTTTLGLVGMRERAAQLGGMVDIASHAGAGTTVTVTLPSTDSVRESTGNGL
jgi:signal transduction histidine kinase